jgi:methionine-rich copper-binding protein CopC
MRAIAAGVLWVIALTALAPPAGAHAELDTAEPVPNQVTDELDELVLFFFGGISQVSVVLTAPDGSAVELGDAELVGPAEARIPVAGDDLAGGTYRVDWAAVSADDAFPANGAYSFTYEPAPSRSILPTLAIVAAAMVGVGAVLWWLRKPAKPAPAARPSTARR